MVQFLFRLVGYSLSMILGRILYKFTYEVYQEYKNITLCSTGKYIIPSLLKQKFDAIKADVLQLCYISAVIIGIFSWPRLRGAVFMETDFFLVLITTTLLSISKNYRTDDLKDSYRHFIRYSGLDCGSFMAYSFYHGYIKYVVPRSDDVQSKDLIERINDYEATEGVTFPVKKLLILQPQTMCIPPTLRSDTMQTARNLEPVLINRGGVHGRSYQLSVYKIEGTDWYVNVQGASPLLTYYEESERSQQLAKYKNEVARSFLENLKRLIANDISCNGLVEVFYYNDLDEDGLRVDVGEVLKKYIEEYLRRQTTNGIH